MTKAQFKKALLRGQGLCIQVAKTEPQKYFETVLWACSHETAFDPQCEGTHSWFVYQLINCYTDKTPFLEATINCLANSKSNGGWKILYAAELLNFFAIDGEETADKALWAKYKDLYARLSAKKRLPNDVFHEKDDFAMLCMVLAFSKEAFLKIADDIGRLYKENKLYSGSDFDWLYAAKGKRHMSALIKAAKKSENIAEYIRVQQLYEEEFEKQISNTAENPLAGGGVALSARLKNHGDKETVLQYAEAYTKQQEPEARAEALEAFCICPYPEDPSPIIEDAKSGCKNLREAAWRALENIRHPLVREFAVKTMQTDTESALPLLIKNYRETDADLLERLVKSVPADFKGNNAWHGIQSGVLGLNDGGFKAPASLLKYIYETTYCSCCRLYALEQMGRRRLLTNEILQECLFDCNYETRAYAKKCLKRRKS